MKEAKCALAEWPPRASKPRPSSIQAQFERDEMCPSGMAASGNVPDEKAIYHHTQASHDREPQKMRGRTRFERGEMWPSGMTASGQIRTKTRKFTRPALSAGNQKPPGNLLSRQDWPPTVHGNVPSTPIIATLMDCIWNVEQNVILQ